MTPAVGLERGPVGEREAVGDSMMVVRLTSRVRPAGTGTSSNSLRCLAGPDEEAHDVSMSPSAQKMKIRDMEVTSHWGRRWWGIPF